MQITVSGATGAPLALPRPPAVGLTTFFDVFPKEPASAGVQSEILQ